MPSIPESVSRQAVAWLVALDAPDATASTQTAFQSWLDAHPDHRHAWQLVESFGRRLRDLDSTVAQAALAGERTTGAAAPRRPSPRRRGLKKLGLFALATSGAAWWAREGPGSPWQADYQTATGEQRRLILADGSEVLLNTASAIDVHFDAGQRRVRLRRGEILVTTAADPDAAQPTLARPFLVETAEGSIRALGTRFVVRQLPTVSTAAVFEGALEITPRDNAGAVLRLSTGRATRFSRTLADQTGPADVGSIAWRTGMLIAQDQPISDFLAELSRYRPGVLACDPALAHLRVSGAYPLEDGDRVLDMLQRTLPIEVDRLTRYWVRVRPRR